MLKMPGNINFNGFFFLTIQLSTLNLLLLLLLRSTGYTHTSSPRAATKLDVRWRSAAVPHSLVLRSAPSGQDFCRCSSDRGQSCRMWADVWSAWPHWHVAVAVAPILFRCARRPQCPVRMRKIRVWFFLSSVLIGSFCAW